MTCHDCNARIPKSANGTYPKRCPACTREYHRTKMREQYRKKHGGRQSAIDAGAVYEYLETNPGQTPRELGLIFWGVAKDTGAVCSKLESNGYLVWLDDRNRIHPYRRIEI